MITPINTKLKNRSGSITAGGTAQDVYGDNDSPKHYIGMQNNSDTVMYFDFGRTATAATSFKLAPGSAWENPAGVMFYGRLSILCATTGKEFVCKTA